QPVLALEAVFGRKRERNTRGTRSTRISCVSCASCASCVPFPFFLLHDRLHYGGFEIPDHLLIGSLHHEETDQLLFRIHPEMGTKGALPAERSIRKRYVSCYRVRDHTHAQSPGFAARPAG